MSQKKVLFITNQLPYPPSTGGKIKSWNLVKYLSLHFQLSICSLIKNEEKNDESKMLENLDLVFYYSEQLDIPRSASSLLKSYLKGITLNVFRNYSKSFRSIVDEHLSTYDLVIVDHYDMYPYVLGNNKIKKILHQHNAEFCLWKRMGDLEWNPIKKVILLFEARRIKKAEIKYCKDADLVWAAPNDVEVLSNLGLENSKFEITYHLGNDENLNRPDIEFEKTEESIIFVGTQTWEANIDGLEWFLEKCWPRVIEKAPSAKIYIIGKNPSERVLKFARKFSNIIFTGFIEDLEIYFTKARVSIVPLRFGSGMKVKLLDSLFRGIPTVSTSVGAEGIEVMNDKHLFINDDPLEFADYILRLFSDTSLWEQFRDNSRVLAKNKYSWKSLLAKHRKEMEKLLAA